METLQLGAGLSSRVLCCDIALVRGLMCEVSEHNSVVLGSWDRWEWADLGAAGCQGLMAWCSL